MSTISYEQTVEAFQNATEENLRDRFRDQNVVILPAEGDVWIAGDVHDHRRNFDKFLKGADLANNPQRHMVLQELIHGDHFDAEGAEESWGTLLRAAELKGSFPDQVHFLLANHDLAQIHGRGIMKGSISVCEAFNKGVKKAFGSRSGMVQVAITEFLLSFPLAVRCPYGIFFCHSLPRDDEMSAFDYSVFGRTLTGDDYARKVGPVYQLIWGRHTTPPAVAQFAEVVGATILVTGHQPQDSGFATNGPQQLIIASDHNLGVFLNIDLAAEYDMPALLRTVRKFVALDV